MQAYGSDRVRRGKGSQWLLLCPRSKGWVARKPARTLVATAAPGTTVLWEEQYFEVVSETPSGSGVRYVLEPWREENVIRVIDSYDEASEGLREREHRAAVKREAQRRLVNALGVLTGHLPAAVQERLASELGVAPVRLTLFSLLLPLACVAWIANMSVARYMGGQPIFIGAIVAALFLFGESMIRMQLTLSQNRPVGSLAGWLLYAGFYCMTPNRTSLIPPVKRPSPTRLRLEVPPETRQRDVLTVVDPLLTLLSAAEQRTLAEKLGYDYRRSSSKVAVLILMCAVPGVGTSVATLSDGWAISPLLSLITAAGLAIEQILRLWMLRSGPAGSMLGPLVRPLVRRILPEAR